MLDYSIQEIREEEKSKPDLHYQSIKQEIMTTNSMQTFDQTNEHQQKSILIHKANKIKEQAMLYLLIVAIGIGIGICLTERFSALYYIPPLITYVQIGPDPLPDKYVELLKLPNTQLIGNTLQSILISQWNETENLKINISQYTLAQQVDMTKVLFLYFYGGIYSDFDTVITDNCLLQIQLASLPDDQILFTNIQAINDEDKPINIDEIGKQNFMKVNKPGNPIIKRMIEAEIKKVDRWKQCKERQCVLFRCQKHRCTGTYKK